jgi:hypothetical protein
MKFVDREKIEKPRECDDANQKRSQREKESRRRYSDKHTKNIGGLQNY